jgi:hypothetical protein
VAGYGRRCGGSRCVGASGDCVSWMRNKRSLGQRRRIEKRDSLLCILCMSLSPLLSIILSSLIQVTTRKQSLHSSSSCYCGGCIISKLYKTLTTTMLLLAGNSLISLVLVGQCLLRNEGLQRLVLDSELIKMLKNSYLVKYNNLTLLNTE